VCLPGRLALRRRLSVALSRLIRCLRLTAQAAEERRVLELTHQVRQSAPAGRFCQLGGATVFVSWVGRSLERGPETASSSAGGDNGIGHNKN
jgi:hypothetical protein